MAYGIEIRNVNNRIIIDQNYPMTVPVESFGAPSTVPGTGTDPFNPVLTVFPGYSGYNGNVQDEDIIVAQPNRNPASPTEAQYVGGMNGLWTFNSPAMSRYGVKYYRLRKITTASTSGYGMVIYDENENPTFDYNSLDTLFDVVALPAAGSAIAWYDIPSGENIDDHYVVLGRETSTSVEIPFGSSLITWKNAAIFDYANNRIGFRSGIGTQTFFSSGKVGKII